MVSCSWCLQARVWVVVGDDTVNREVGQMLLYSPDVVDNTKCVVSRRPKSQLLPPAQVWSIEDARNTNRGTGVAGFLIIARRLRDSWACNTETDWHFGMLLLKIHPQYRQILAKAKIFFFGRKSKCLRALVNRAWGLSLIKMDVAFTRDCYLLLEINGSLWCSVIFK